RSSREGLIKSAGHPSGAKAPASYWAFTDGLKAVPFKEPNLIRASLGRRFEIVVNFEPRPFHKIETQNGVNYLLRGHPRKVRFVR
ncbi:MAG: hypothetical protein WAN09_09265, partial [Candidatus Korobacteraceae bacterium]